MPSFPFARALTPATDFLKRLTIIKPQEAKLTVGLDVGSTSVKAVALGPRRGDGTRPIVGQSLIPLAAGQDADGSEAMKAAIAALKCDAAAVTLSVSGQWVIMRIIEMPKLKPEEFKKALPFEAQRYVPFNIQDVVIDGAILGPSDANKMWAVIVACRKELLERRIDWAKRAGVEVGLIDVDALALTNAFLAGGDQRRAPAARALINVGAQVTNLVILRGETPYLVRDIPWGGEKLARAVADQMSLEPAAVSQALAQAEPPPEIANALKLASEVLVTELQLSFDYFENRFNQPPEEMLVSGGLSLSPGLLAALKSHLTQSVAPWAPAQELTGQCAVAYGLALRTN